MIVPISEGSWWSGLHDTTASLGVFTAVFGLVYMIMHKSDRDKKQPPSLPSLPLIGSYPFLPSPGEVPEFFRRASKTLGPVFAFHLTSEYTIVINSRQSLIEAFKKQSLVYADRYAPFTVQLVNPQRKGIIFHEYNNEFRKNHQLTLSILKEFGFGDRIIEQRILVEADDLLQQFDQHDGSDFDPSIYFKVYTINVILSIVFGRRWPYKSDELLDLAHAYRRLMQSKISHLDHCSLLRFLPKYKKIIDDVWTTRGFIFDFIDRNITDALDADTPSFVTSFAAREEFTKKLIQLWMEGRPL